MPRHVRRTRYRAVFRSNPTRGPTRTIWPSSSTKLSKAIGAPSIPPPVASAGQSAALWHYPTCPHRGVGQPLRFVTARLPAATARFPATAPRLRRSRRPAARHIPRGAGKLLPGPPRRDRVRRRARAGAVERSCRRAPEARHPRHVLRAAGAHRPPDSGATCASCDEGAAARRGRASRGGARPRSAPGRPSRSAPPSCESSRRDSSRMPEPPHRCRHKRRGPRRRHRTARENLSRSRRSGSVSPSRPAPILRGITPQYLFMVFVNTLVTVRPVLARAPLPSTCSDAMMSRSCCPAASSTSPPPTLCAPRWTRIRGAARLVPQILRGLSFIDSTGLHTHVALHERAQRERFRLDARRAPGLLSTERFAQRARQGAPVCGGSRCRRRRPARSADELSAPAS